VTRQLVLIRHAKAADGLADIDRPLTARGRRDATAIGDWLAAQTLSPDRVVVSPARRTRETWDEAAHQLGYEVEPIIEPLIYENTVDDLLDVVRVTSPDVRTLVLVGHNPSMGTLAFELDGEASAHFIRGYPTSAATVFTLASTFADLTLGSATLTADNLG
jgi:phosphohistidine phosphatase